MQLSELQVLGENKQKSAYQSQVNGQKQIRNKTMVTDGNGASPLLTIGNDGENKNPLNTNISAAEQAIFMIEDAGNKSSKGKHTASDGRQSSIGHEIFNSKPQ